MPAHSGAAIRRLPPAGRRSIYLGRTSSDSGFGTPHNVVIASSVDWYTNLSRWLAGAPAGQQRVSGYGCGLGAGVTGQAARPPVGGSGGGLAEPVNSPG